MHAGVRGEAAPFLLYAPCGNRENCDGFQLRDSLARGGHTLVDVHASRVKAWVGRWVSYLRSAAPSASVDREMGSSCRVSRCVGFRHLPVHSTSH